MKVSPVGGVVSEVSYWRFLQAYDLLLKSNSAGDFSHSEILVPLCVIEAVESALRQLEPRIDPRYDGIETAHLLRMYLPGCSVNMRSLSVTRTLYPTG